MSRRPVFFRSIAGIITSSIRDDHGHPIPRMSLDDALSYVKTLDTELRRAARSDEIEAVIFFRRAKRDLDAAVFEAVGFVGRQP